MKVLLINQNPVIKKLVGMAGKKLNLDIENAARIAQGFRANDYICIIVDDDSVGKNLELLTALQDKVKVCLLFARQTQIKKHEFNIAIQKPFLPTDILEILNDCIPKEGEISKANNGDNLDQEYNDIHTNEIDMDLKSAEIEPPEGIDLDSISLQKEAEQVASQDTDSMLDFNPDSLDLSDLESAEEVQTGEVQAKEMQDGLDAKEDENKMEGNSVADEKGVDGAMQDMHTESSEAKHEEYVEPHHTSIFDSDLSDLKPSNDDPLDLENFDLDSIMDASALKEASLGIPSRIDKEAREVAGSIDDDDLFLSDDERELLQPSPKKFMQARKEEEQKELESGNLTGQNETKQKMSENESWEKIDDNLVADNAKVYNEVDNADGNSTADNRADDLDGELQKFGMDEFSLDENLKDIQEKSTSNPSDSLQSQQTKNNTQENNDIDSLDLPEITNDTLEVSGLTESDKNTGNTVDAKIADMQDDVNIDLMGQNDLGQDGLEHDDLDNSLPKKNSVLDNAKTDGDKSFKEDIDTIDLSVLDETLKMQEAQKDSVSSALDEAFDDLTAALNSAFDNMSFDTEPKETDEMETQGKTADERLNQDEDSKGDELSEFDLEDDLKNLENLDNLESSAEAKMESEIATSEELNAESKAETINDLDNLDLESLMDMDSDININVNMETKKEDEADLQDFTQDSKEELNGEFNADSLESSDLDKLELTDILEEDSKVEELGEFDLKSLDNLESSAESNTDFKGEPNIESSEKSNVESKSEVSDVLDNFDLEGLSDFEANDVSFNTEPKETDEIVVQHESNQDIDSSLDALLQMDILQEDSESNNQENSNNDLDTESIKVNDELNLMQTGESSESALSLLDDEKIDSKQGQDELVLDDLSLDESLPNDEDGSLSIENEGEIDLEAMLDTSDLTEKDNTPNSSIIPKETIAEVNEALKSINEEFMNIDMENVEAEEKLDSQDSVSEVESPNTTIHSENKDSDESELLSNLFDENQPNNETLEIAQDSAEGHDIQTELESMQDGGQEALSADVGELDSFDELDFEGNSKSKDKDLALAQKEKLGGDHAIGQQADTEMTYVTLPSNEDSIEKLTETELAEALGESEMPIMRLEQPLDAEDDIKDSNIEDSMQNAKDGSDESGNELFEYEMPSGEFQQNVIKELDANSLIDLFKNTPKDKLHEIFDGSEITFNIRFGKNEK